MTKIHATQSKAAAVLAAALCSFAMPAPGFAQTRKAAHDPIPVGQNRQPRYVRMPLQPSPIRANAVAATIPFWQATDGTYTYQMVGTSPLVAQASPSTTIASPIVPIILKFSDGTVFDPTAKGSCSATSPASLLLASPIFVNTPWTVGGTNVGTTQYPDFFQRASFWSTTGATGGLNPNYHVLLSPSTTAAITLNVPAASGVTVTAPCGKMGEMDINWFDPQVQGTVFTQLAAMGVLPSQFPILLLSNVVMYQGTSASCCILGYHSAFNNNNGGFGGAVQTYGVADFETSGSFGTSYSDVATLSHEISEWMDDPTGNNPTPYWGHIGQQTGCQNNLEVGDPLSGTGITVTGSNAYTYHLQEMAFKSWFYRNKPSSGVNGWYSSNGTFTTPSTPCEASTTSLTVNPTTLAAGASTTLTVKVAAASGYSGTPTGTATVVSSLNGSTVATYTLANGSGSSTVAIPAGSYNLTANYSGDANFAASSSSAVAVKVGSASLTLSPISLTFASTTVGVASATQSVTVKNGGTAPASFSSVAFTGGSPLDFSQSNNCGSSLAVGASCTISVTFKPTAAGTRSSSLTITDSAAGSPQTVPVTGTAVAAASPKVSLNPTSLSFTTTTVGSTSALQVVTLTNSGSAALTGIAVSLTGSNSVDFNQTNTCGSSVAAAGTCTISVAFKPTASGTRNATISIADNATGSPQTVSLSGTGANPPAAVVSLSPTSLNFPSTTVGTSSTALTVTLTNTGNASLSTTSSTLAGAYPGDFSKTTTCGATLAAGANCTFSLTFKPTAKASRTATLSIADSATGSPQSVSLSGTGK